MAYINSTIYSNVLMQEVALDLFLPNDKPDRGIIEPQGVIYFLHGLGSSEKRFREYTAVNRYAADNDLAMVYVSAYEIRFAVLHIYNRGASPIIEISL